MAPALSFSPKAEEQDEEFWNHYRKERLTEKDRNTYHLLDSISQKVKLDKKMRTVMAIAMLSRQNVNTLKQVFLHLKLNKYSNIELFKIDQHISEEPFISASTPSVFIYDTSGNLIINRKGYSDPRELINTILNEQKN